MKIFDLLYVAATIAYILAVLSICGTAAQWLEWLNWRQWYRKLFKGDRKMTVSKKLTSKSGLTIPKHVRAETGFMPGMAVDIETVADGVLIRKRVPTCQFCGSVHDVVKIHGMEMCGQCAAALREELDNVGA